jgi:hypothetical protein
MDALSLLTKVLDRIPEDVGLTIDDRCGYPNTVSRAVGIDQSKLDILLHASGILYFHGGKRRYKATKFDFIVHQLTTKDKKFRVIYHRFSIEGISGQHVTYLVAFRNPVKHREIVHTHRLDAMLIKEIDSCCKVHPLPSIDETLKAP